MNSLALHELLSRLDLTKDVEETRMPAYEELYPDSWLEDKSTRDRHRDAVTKIINWPRDENNRVSKLFGFCISSLAFQIWFVC
jgi:hypothetical protein